MAIVQSLVVHKRSRRQGVGKAFMEALEAEAVAAGLSCLYVRTPDMAPFYISCGYRVAETGPYPWSKPTPGRKGVWLLKPLAAGGGGAV